MVECDNIVEDNLTVALVSEIYISAFSAEICSAYICNAISTLCKEKVPSHFLSVLEHMK